MTACCAPDPSHRRDAEIAEATGALIRHRSIAALIEAHERHRDRRLALALDGRCTCSIQAGELAPVFGLAGTLDRAKPDARPPGCIAKA